CAGARSAPLVVQFAGDARFRTWSFFEERSAAFFALGRIKATGLPVAVVTTSGTAAGELLPGTMEADYSGLPLVLVTADRPRRFRGTGAPQAAEQVGLFGVYVEQKADLAEAERVSLSDWTRTRPLHLNVCFDEPLLGPPPTATTSVVIEIAAPVAPFDAKVAQVLLGQFLEASRSPLVIVGPLAAAERGPALDFLTALGAPVLAESLSGLRGNPRLEHLALHAGAQALKNADGTVWMDGVLRLGGVPTQRLWRDLDDSLSHLPLLSLSTQPFTGATHGELIHAPLARLLPALNLPPRPPSAGQDALLARDRVFDTAIQQLLDSEPRSEPGLIARLSEIIPGGARLFLGNSLPVREWDLAASQANRNFEIAASRGLNGIDGQISTFLGFSEEGHENWALVGDLTAMYDMAAPWILGQRPDLSAHLVIINNGGGKIFERMFANPAFQNPHTLHFEPLARFWGLEYAHWEDVPATLPTVMACRTLTEIVPDDDATHRFWAAYDALTVEAA
ncbi:MAG: 2-succinyl-5-enolpyruvyl-6-hydroxy-3-cyclohexene-1-carboxylic-acid synthase, partial [Armatimonadota bacterium]|nr:2-succinyl-5-enolpyruvyl-6-hydroxy-3-cyclohexene-1-carboxylic-acid synthase [Armatimonadota bacterium]